MPPTKFEMEQEVETEEQKTAVVEKQKEAKIQDDDGSAEGQGTQPKEVEDKYKDFLYNMYFEQGEIDKI